MPTRPCPSPWRSCAYRVCRHLTRRGWLEGEDESAFLSGRARCEDGLDALRMSEFDHLPHRHRRAGRAQGGGAADDPRR